ncbi:lipoate--protein ligase family protein [Limosilactobacillus kribbianus]|uniref:lipoate--protein ligase family protein n=1 Tax=Limosilactobacillus kribbianus TaxID=2982695 RepID=UPI0022649648|nr:lipoate--protein ligase family protein [Limosilactobacillus kribbianus]
MENFNQQHVEYFDQPLKPANNLTSFAYTNALLRSSKEMSAPLLHFWSLQDSVILGLKDQRLPYLDRALRFLTDRGYHYFMRNSGGLAVVSDAGVLNFSLFFPWHLEDHELKIDEAYQRMEFVVSQAFPELTIETGEITHSYCPGTFDLSVNGQKIGGISQRRNTNGVVVMLYLSVNGDQLARGELIRDFYSRGLQGAENKWHFPDIWPTSMVNIEELLHQPLSIEDTKQRLLNVFANHGQDDFTQLTWSPNFIRLVQDEMDTMTRLQERLHKEG